MKHTPTPWRTDPGGHDADIQTADGRMELATTAILNLRAAFELDFKCPSPEENYANAAFIVRAVNCHEKLLRELKAALRIFERDQVRASSTQYARIRAIIAKAEEGKG